MNKVLVAYVENGDFKKQMEFELLWSNLMKKYSSESGLENEVGNRNFRTAKFVDGTILKAIPIRSNQALRGERANVVYTHKDASPQLVQILQTIVNKGNFENNIIFFEAVDGVLKLTN